MKTSDRMNSVRESGTARMARIAREMEAAGSSILKLGTGEPDFDTPGSGVPGHSWRADPLYRCDRNTTFAGSRLGEVPDRKLD